MASVNYPRCPRCRSQVHRRRRQGWEIWISSMVQRRPYFCKHPHCSWRGWLPSPPADAQPVQDQLEFMATGEIGDAEKWDSLS